jgi:adenylylsulfate kinase-like enzyme
MKKLNKNKGILFWITGLSGAGKTTLGNKIKKDINKIYGPTIMISGDDIRKIFKLKGYEYKDRLEILNKYNQFAKYITDQKINIILAVVGMVDAPRIWNRTNIDNYIEIYIKCKIRNIIDLNKKKIYNKKKGGKIIGIDIKPEYPKNPDITIINSFKSSSNNLSKILINKINILLNKKAP